MKSSTTYLALWLIATLVAVLLSMNMLTAAYVDGHYIPVGNDSFYHARRILDAAIGERGFYQFDDMIHVPEGSWLSWPWAYAYLTATALSLVLWLNPAMDPMTFIAYVPVFWLLINTGLLTLIARQIQLNPAFGSLVLFGFALSPLTQTLHGVGIIDHHFIEQTFVLATALMGLRFFSKTDRASNAILFGAVLGIAPAFHNGLFVLQAPVLLCFLVSWYRGEMTNNKSTLHFSAALLVTTVAVLIPSGPFRDMQFEFWTLSWFHLYVAACTTACIVFMTFVQFRKKSIILLFVIGAALAAPLFAKALIGASFVSGELSIIREVHEVKSPFTRLTERGGLIWITSFYSWFFFLVPVLIVAFAVRAWRHKDSFNLFFSVFGIFSLLMLLAQYRFHPFGSWAILIGGLFFAQKWSERLKLTSPASIGIAILVFAFAYQPPVKNRLFHRYSPGNSVDYAATWSLYSALADSCAEETGVAVAYNDDGHYVRYHTDCSVISNNFLLTPQHEQKVDELDQLLQLDPEQFLVAAPHVNHVFARMNQIFSVDENGLISAAPIPQIASSNAPLFVALIFGEELPEEYVLLDELRVEDERDFAYARVYKIVRDRSEKETGR